MSHQSFSKRRAIRENWQTVESLALAVAGFSTLSGVLMMGFVAAYIGGLASGGHPTPTDQAAFYYCGVACFYLIPALILSLALAMYAKVKAAY